MLRIRSRLMAMLAFLTCCFNKNVRNDDDSSTRDTKENFRDKLHSCQGCGDISIDQSIKTNREATKRDSSPGSNHILDPDYSKYVFQRETEHDTENIINNVKVQVAQMEVSNSTKHSIGEGQTLEGYCAYFRVNEADENRRVGITESNRPHVPPSPSGRVRGRQFLCRPSNYGCTQSAIKIRHTSQERPSKQCQKRDITRHSLVRPRTAEELHRRYCHVMKRAELRRKCHRSKTQVPANTIEPEQSDHESKAEHSSDPNIEVYTPVTRPPTPIPRTGNCLDEKLLLKRRMIERIDDTLFEEPEDDDEEPFSLRKFPALRRSRPTKRLPHDVAKALRCRSLSSVHGIRLYSPSQRSADNAPRKMTASQKRPPWPTGRTVLRQANKIHRHVTRGRHRPGRQRNLETQNN